MVDTVRYWDGNAWTRHRAPAAKPAPAASTPARTPTAAQRPTAPAPRGYWARYRARFFTTCAVMGVLTAFSVIVTQAKDGVLGDGGALPVVVDVVLSMFGGGVIWGVPLTFIVAIFGSRRR
jgi:hypothetical protein